jgi:hypothetical protein
LAAPTGAGKTDTDSGFPFSVGESAKLRPAKQVTQALILTPDGRVPTPSPLDPMFIVAPSIGFTPIGEKRSFAMKRLQAMPGITQVRVIEDNPITIAGLSGFEAVAEAVAGAVTQAGQARAGLKMVLYQVALFDGDSYVLLNGLVGADFAPEYLPEFKALARTLHKKRR